MGDDMKKGFTLIELLAVIIILSLLVTIIGVSVTKVLKKSKEDLYNNVQLESIKKSAEMWGAYNMGKLPSSGCVYITLSTLQEEELINEDIVDVRNTNNNIEDVYIKITKSGNSYLYEVSDNHNGCTLVSGG